MCFGSGVSKHVNFSMAIRKVYTKKNILVFGGKDACRFNDILGSSFAPTDSARILLIEDTNGFALDAKFSTLHLDVALEATMN